jgi:hypothetical protein
VITDLPHHDQPLCRASTARARGPPIPSRCPRRSPPPGPRSRTAPAVITCSPGGVSTPTKIRDSTPRINTSVRRLLGLVGGLPVPPNPAGPRSTLTALNPALSERIIQAPATYASQKANTVTSKPPSCAAGTTTDVWLRHWRLRPSAKGLAVALRALAHPKHEPGAVPPAQMAGELSHLSAANDREELTGDHLHKRYPRSAPGPAEIHRARREPPQDRFPASLVARRAYQGIGASALRRGSLNPHKAATMRRPNPGTGQRQVAASIAPARQQARSAGYAQIGNHRRVDSPRSALQGTPDITVFPSRIVGRALPQLAKSVGLGHRLYLELVLA